jgi:hypothetical protein
MKRAVAVVAIMLPAIVMLCSGCGSEPADPGAQLGELPSYSKAELMELRDIQLAQYATDHELENVPGVELVRFVEPDEWAGAQIECLNASGYSVKLTDDGDGLDFSAVPPQQQYRGSPLDLAGYVCEAEYTFNPRYNQPLTDAQLRVLYGYFVDDLTPCLEARGLAVDDAPSESAFVESYDTGAWVPYDSVNPDTLTTEEWNALTAECPQNPEPSSLYAD